MDKKRKISLKKIILLLLAAFIGAGFVNSLKIQKYVIDSEKIKNPVRIALIADLHSCKYGENQHKLLSALEAQNPDLLMLSGDIFDDKLPDENTEKFLMGLNPLYPVFYVTGNHEYWSGKKAFPAKMNILEKYGVTILSGETETITVKGETLNICGVDDPDSYMVFGEDSDYRNFSEQITYVKNLSQNGNYTILLSHRPEYFDFYCQKGFDMVLCGHAHGGQWRIPGILNGVFAPNQGFFPKYAGGKYETDGTVMLVSRGLARESTRIPRFYNRPELVIIDLV